MNDLNRLHYTILSDPADAAAVRTALSVVPLGVTAGTAVQVDQAVTATTRAATTTLGTSLNHTLSDTSTTITAFNGVAGVTYSCRALGAGSITHHATNLIITQGSAGLTTAAGMTFDVEMITSTTSRVKNVMKADGTAVVTAGLTSTANSIAANVALNDTALFFTGPTVAQGTSGTWFASGTVTLRDAAGAANFIAQLWDGTTVIASGAANSVGLDAPVTISLSGSLASPAGNIRISVRDTTSANGFILANTTALAKDSTLTAVRIA